MKPSHLLLFSFFSAQKMLLFRYLGLRVCPITFKAHIILYTDGSELYSVGFIP